MVLFVVSTFYFPSLAPVPQIGNLAVPQSVLFYNALLCQVIALGLHSFIFQIVFYILCLHKLCQILTKIVYVLNLLFKLFHFISDVTCIKWLI